MNFLRRASSFLSNLRSSNSESTLSKISSFISKISLIHVVIVVAPAVIIFVIFLSFMSVLGFKFDVLQFVDSMSVDSSSSGGVGNFNYTKDDFEKCVNISGGATLSSGYNDFASRASSSTDSNFKDINSFNSYLRNTVNAAGHGTASGVVTAAMTLGCSFPKATGAKLFYVYPNSTRSGHEGVTSETQLDCRAFVQWSVYNGGFKADILDYGTHLNSWGNSHKISSASSIKPGDTFGTNGFGHYGLIVGVYGDTCYTAEENGDTSGLVILDRSCSGLLGSYNVYDMSSYYSDTSNVRAG